MNDPQETRLDPIVDKLDSCLQQQRKAYLTDPVPDYEQRKTDLLASKRMLSKNTEALVDAINKDYGNRSRHETLFAELILAIDGIGLDKREFLKHSRSEDEIALMKTLKQALDPKGILNPGKIFEIPQNSQS